MMDLTRLKMLAERLRVESVGDPEWVESKGVFEYPSQTISPKSAGVDELLVKALGLAAVSDAGTWQGMSVDKVRKKLDELVDRRGAIAHRESGGASATRPRLNRTLSM
jgi:hypothetical protein